MLNRKVIERTAMFIMKGGENARKDEAMSASNFLEFLVKPESEEGLEDIDDFNLTHIENWLLTMYNKVSKETTKSD